MREWLSVWEDWRVEAEEYRRLDDERVRVLFHFNARGRRAVWKWGRSGRLSGGKVIKLVQYLDRERALEAGLAK